MDIFYALIVIIGLAVFETVCSIDNAIINADILSTMREKARRWFLTWGLIIAVFVVRGILPWLIIWISSPGLGLMGALTATFSGDETAAAAISASAPYLLTGGGVFMFFLFLYWLFIEEKHCIVPGERFCTKHGIKCFHAVAGIFLVLLAAGMGILTQNIGIGAAACVGAVIFLIIMLLRRGADKKTAEMEKSCSVSSSNQSDITKLMLLEVIDATFSVDGVVGAFAFTLSVPLILIGNGIGALVVRELTIHNIKNIQRFAYIKNGAMYSILCLGVVMCLEALGVDLPIWFTPALTICIVGGFFGVSVMKIKKDKANAGK